MSIDHVQRKITGLRENKPYRFLKVYKAAYECERPLNAMHAFQLEKKAEISYMPKMYKEYINK